MISSSCRAALGCRLQMGGSDQWGNIVNGIELARRMDGAEVFGVTTPLITTADGAQDGQDRGRRGLAQRGPAQPLRLLAVLAEHATTRDVGKFLRLFTDLPLDEIARLEALEGAEINDAKKALADAATAMLHGETAATAAAETARKTFEEGAGGEALPTLAEPTGEIGMVDALIGLGFAASKGEARRMIAEGAVRLDGDRSINDPDRRDQLRRTTPSEAQPGQEEARAPDHLVRPSSAAGMTLASPEQPDRRVALEQIEADPRRLPALALQPAVAIDQQPGIVACAIGASAAICSGVARRNCGLARLRVPSISPAPRSRRSSSAMRKPSLVSRISASRARAVSLSASPRSSRQIAALLAAPDPAAQLVELGEAEALGMLDHHQRRIGHVDADLDHRRRDQHRELAALRTRPSPRPSPAPSSGRGPAPTRSPKRCRSAAARASAAARSLVSLSSTSGQTQ